MAEESKDFTHFQAQQILRKTVSRIPEGEEIRHINIMPMMDIMTILLVAVIGMATASSLDSALNGVALATSQTSEKIEAEGLVVQITKDQIIVDPGSNANEDSYINLNPQRLVESSYLKNPNDREVPMLVGILGSVREARIKEMEKAKKTIPEVHELWIVADRGTPYVTLERVMFSASRKEAGYQRFRLIVLQNKGS